MNIKIKCYICGNILPVMEVITHKNTIDYLIGYCGYCETIAVKVKKELKLLDKK